MSFRQHTLHHLAVISPLSIESVALAIGQGPTNYASSTYVSANRALFIPFHVYRSILVTKLWSANGATASGNIDVGLYNADKRYIISSGSTAQAGTNTCQQFDITDTLLTPGDYYLAVAMDNATGTLFRSAQTAVNLRRAGLLQQASAFALPTTTFTGAAIASAFIPLIGLLHGGTVL